MKKGSYASEEDFTISETGNWNVADNFSKFKIMKPMINCEIYEDVARYGFDSLLQELMNHDVNVEELRLGGLKRLINELIRLINNTLFAMKKPGTLTEMENIKTKLIKIRDLIVPHSYFKFTNQSTRASGIKIEVKLFEKILEAVSQLKSDINKPLNQNHLIFVDKEEFDPKAFKERIKERIITKG